MLRFLPWKFIVQRAARAYDIADPALWLARIRNFAQPSEVQEPIELLRAGVLFHARGIVNAKAIQHNLDWIWPYWVERQFDPNDVSFIPRAFSLSHVNLTHRNWTAVGLPNLALYPIVDPRGLITPIQDGWSIDFWVFDADNEALIPSRTRDDAFTQRLAFENDLAVETTTRHGELALRSRVKVVAHEGEPVLEIHARCTSPTGGLLVMSVRPYNPEGVQFIDRLAPFATRDGWRINNRHEILIDRAADQVLVSDYLRGDVSSYLVESAQLASTNSAAVEMHCRTGMATGASIYRFDETEAEVTVRVSLEPEIAALGEAKRWTPTVSWAQVREEIATLQLPDERMEFLYEAAAHTMVLLSAGEIVPGPYTYRRFWFRDACLMMNALLALGLTDRCKRAIERFPLRQQRDGYFRSQEGEWDSNGQVLWIIDRYGAVSGELPSRLILEAIDRGVRWIDRKRISPTAPVPHAGLLPAGFSAEHFGPNDHYYWDAFWAEAGLRGAARIYRRVDQLQAAMHAERLADEFHDSIDRSINSTRAAQSTGAMPASPYRRIDAGAVGSLVADYPLQLYPAGEERIMATIEALMQRSFHDGGFFQDVIHSGVNAYLTLDIAQSLLRAGDPRYRKLVETVARLASPTGQWPEAIHPFTHGGCMGDGQHGWAAAEWVMMIRNMFLREEGERLIIGSGLFPEWFEEKHELMFGPTPTMWGPVTVRIEHRDSTVVVSIDGKWRGEAPRIDVALPGFAKMGNVDASETIRLQARQPMSHGATTP